LLFLYDSPYALLSLKKGQERGTEGHGFGSLGAGFTNIHIPGYEIGQSGPLISSPYGVYRGFSAIFWGERGHEPEKHEDG
jgi:hypothetical protein